MGTAVLRSHDPFKNRLHQEAFGSRPPPPSHKDTRRRHPRSSPSRRPDPRPAVRSGLGRRSGDRKVTFDDMGVANAKANTMVVRFPSPNLVMEEVTILKRGQIPMRPLSPPAASDRGGDTDKSPLFSTNRLGPAPEILPKQIGFSEPGQVFAGPSYVSSPDPSSLPFPVFVKKGDLVEEMQSDLATRSLRSLLGLGNTP